MARSVGLRTEILITITLLMVAALLFGGVLLLRLTEQSLLEQRVTQLDAVSKVLANSLAAQTRDDENWNDRSAQLKLLNNIPDELHSDGWWLYAGNLTLVAAYHAGSEPLTPEYKRQQVKMTLVPSARVKFPSLLDIFSSGEARAHFIVPLVDQNHFAGLLELGFSLQDIRQRLWRVQKLILLYVLLYGSVLVFFGYYQLKKNIIKPTQNLFRATEAVRLGNLETRLPTTGPLEISQLADAYNRMTEALLQSRQETQLHIESLEEKNSELQQARDELIRSEKMASVGQLAAGLAHELGNPLSALIGYLEVLKQRTASEDDRDILRRSLDETERLDYLVRELLDFARPADTATVEVFDPLSELKASLELVINQGHIGSIQVSEKLPDRLPAIRMSRQKLRQVFINLLLNAVHACQPDGKIELSAGSGHGQVWLAIRDNGCGISAAALKDIFNPFYTTKEPGQGTGLGLTVCDRIVSEAGGRIATLSHPEQGSSFRVEFPVA